MLGRGDAGVALASRETALFYNPAHLARATDSYFTLVGVAIGASTNVEDAYTLYDEKLQFEDEASFAENRETSRQALDLFGAPALVRSTLHLPTFGFRVGPVGVSAGGYVNQAARVQALDFGTPISTVSVFGKIDEIIAVSAGLPLTKGLSVGVTGRHVRRHVTAYRETVDALDALPVLEGTAMAVDFGLLYETALPGLTAGLSVYDAVGGDMTYREGDLHGLIDPVDADPRAVQSAQEMLSGLGDPSFRVGAAYALPTGHLWAVKSATLLADYVSASSTTLRQSTVQKLRVGAETAHGPLRIRGGLGQGAFSAGGGLNLLFLQLDYAYYGRQEGFAPEHGTSRAHMLQLRFGR
jgi:hypothetical protein